VKQLNEIIEQAASDDARLVSILRKCLVVAVQLGNERLKQWVLSELNGYDDVEGLPAYRVYSVGAKGFFLGPLQGQLRDQPLASGVLDKKHRWWATTGRLMQPISAYEALSQGDTHGSLRLEWPADLVAQYQTKFIQGWALNRAWQELPMGAVIAVVDTVRTRLLQFALEIQAEMGMSAEGEMPPSAEKVEQAVQTIIYGGYNIVGSSVTGDIQMIGKQLVVEGDFFSLSSALKDAGVGEEKVRELEQAIDADRAEGAEKGFGGRVASWLQKAGTYIGKEGVKAASNVAQKAITPLVLAYFGLSSS
jgi:hypothetical protein